MRAEYTVFLEISRPVFTELKQQLGFLSISGAFFASREAFFGARAREKSRKKRRSARTKVQTVRRWKSRSKSQAVRQMAMLRHISERHLN